MLYPIGLSGGINRTERDGMLFLFHSMAYWRRTINGVAYFEHGFENDAAAAVTRYSGVGIGEVPEECS